MIPYWQISPWENYSLNRNPVARDNKRREYTFMMRKLSQGDNTSGSNLVTSKGCSLHICGRKEKPEGCPPTNGPSAKEVS